MILFPSTLSEKARLQAEAKAAEEARRKAEAEAAAEAKRKRELEREAARQALLQVNWIYQFLFVTNVVCPCLNATEKLICFADGEDGGYQ